MAVDPELERYLRELDEACQLKGWPAEKRAAFLKDCAETFIREKSLREGNSFFNGCLVVLIVLAGIGLFLYFKSK